jgi:hypothetical protein
MLAGGWALHGALDASLSYVQGGHGFGGRFLGFLPGERGKAAMEGKSCKWQMGRVGGLSGPLANWAGGVVFL